MKAPQSTRTVKLSTSAGHRFSAFCLRDEVAARLNQRRAEIGEGILARIYAVSDPTEMCDSSYVEGLRSAASAALDYALASIRKGDLTPQPVPLALRGQAQLAAHEGVRLDTVVRRYVAGHTLVADFVMQEAKMIEDFDHDTLKSILGALGMLLERLLEAVADEYGRASASLAQSSEQRRASLARQLLAGDPVDPSRLDYDLTLSHVGMVMAGPGVETSSRELRMGVDCRCLVVQPRKGVAWVWFGARNPIESAALVERLAEGLSSGVALSLGEPSAGLSGWRLTHRQAKSAWPIAMRRVGRPVRYADVALLATAVSDEVLGKSLLDIYMVPLMCEQDRGETLRQTLRAYFQTGRNASSAAAKMGVSRQTVNERLRKVEKRLGGGPLDTCAPELETALHLYEFESRASA